MDTRLAGLLSAQACGVTQAAVRAEAVGELASVQHGLLSAAQLDAQGISRAVIRGNIDAGRWRRLSRRVVALHCGPLSPEAVAWFAVLDGGERCVVAGLSALHQCGLEGFPVSRVRVAVPVDGRPGRHDLYIRRRCRRLTPDAVHPARLPPVLRADVALADALEHMTAPARSCALLAAVVQQKLMRADAVCRLIAAEPTLPRRSLYLAVAGDIAGGSQSLLEIDFASLARRAGLPPPRRQAVRVDRSGRRRYLDADFGGFAVEVDGAVHLKAATWWDDMARQNAVVLGGTPVLRFASVAVRLHPEQVVAQLRAACKRWC